MGKLTIRGISTHEESKGEWKRGYLIEDEGVSYIINGVVEANDEYITIREWCSVEPETLGLSTGLFDKNGTEIFEGDILFGHAGEDFWEVVEFDIEEGKWVRRDIWYNSKLDLSENNQFMEIVGNIYENPDLLKEK